MSLILAKFESRCPYEIVLAKKVYKTEGSFVGVATARRLGHFLLSITLSLLSLVQLPQLLATAATRLGLLRLLSQVNVIFLLAG